MSKETREEEGKLIDLKDYFLRIREGNNPPEPGDRRKGAPVINITRGRVLESRGSAPVIDITKRVRKSAPVTDITTGRVLGSIEPKKVSKFPLDCRKGHPETQERLDERNIQSEYQALLAEMRGRIGFTHVVEFGKEVKENAKIIGNLRMANIEKALISLLKWIQKQATQLLNMQ
jgi:hypothetical protein